MEKKLGWFCFGLVSFVTSAFGSSQEAILLDEKQASLMERLSRLEKVSQYHGRYVVLRETYLSGPQGLKALSDSWFQQAEQWLKEWYVLLRITDQATDLAQDAVRQDLLQRLKNQQDQWQILSELAGNIFRRASAGQRELEAMGDFSPQFIPAYESHLTALRNESDNLRKSFSSAMTFFGLGKMGQYANIVEPSTRAMLARLNKAMLNVPELREAAAQVEQAFQAELLVEPHVRHIHALFREFDQFDKAARVFHAESALARLEQEAQTALVQIGAAPVDAVFKNPARAEVTRTWEQAKAQYADHLRRSSKGRQVFSLFVRDTAVLASQCRREETRMQLNCELLRTLTGIKPEQVLSMDESHLRILEFAFDKVQSGPLSTGGR